MFGGTANLDHILITGVDDDGFDWDNGYSGKVQFMIIQQAYNTGDKGFEGDNLQATYNATPRSHPEFWNVTLPNIIPPVALMVVLVTIFSFLTFDYIYLITQGGPARSTEMLSTFAYAFAFTSFQVGKASTVALVMSFFGLVASVLYVRLSRSELEA